MLWQKHVNLLLIGKTGQKHKKMFLSKILMHLCMIMHCIMEENILAVIVCTSSVLKKY